MATSARKPATTRRSQRPRGGAKGSAQPPDGKLIYRFSEGKA